MRYKQRKNNDLMRYAGLGAQLFVSLGLAVFAGYKGDNWLKPGIPLLIWVLPLAVVSVMIYKLIKETSKQKPGHEEKKK